ncbi:MAG: hypothetical protein WC971_07615 [Coriobacteriia bacterium]
MTDTGTSPSRGGWDYTLMLGTFALLGALGVQSFAGTLWAWWAQRSAPDWPTTGYPGFVVMMNAVAAPLVVALVVVMGLCVPKRLLARRALVVASAMMLLVGFGVWGATGRLAYGLGAYLAAAAVLQAAVVVLTLAGAPSLRYLTEGRLTKAGSGLLHLGFVLFALDIVALQSSRALLPVFWVSAGATMCGTVMSFYAEGIGRTLRARG